MELSPDRAADIAIQHKLRSAFKHRPEREELGVKVPVAEVRQDTSVRYVRLGPTLRS